MTTDDFFRRLDEEAEQRREQANKREKEERERTEAQEEDSRKTAQAVKPKMEEYKRGLEARGVEVEFVPTDAGFRFMVLERRGGGHCLELKGSDLNEKTPRWVDSDTTPDNKSRLV